MIAITGINGLLGSFIAKRLIEEKKSIVGIKREGSDVSLLNALTGQLPLRDAEVSDSIGLTSAFEGADTVIHVAGLVSFNPQRMNEIMAVNIEGTRNVVNACLSAGVKRLVFISSVAALGRQKGVVELNEEAKWVESSLNSHYAKSKYMAELEVYRGQEEGLEVAIVNPSIILAPTDWNKSSSQIFKYVWEERKFYTKGQINFVDVRDVADIVHLILTKNIFGEKFIANGGAVEWTDFFQMIGAKFNRQPPSIAVNKSLVYFVALAEEVRARIFGYEPAVTRQSVKMAKGKFYYSNKKSVERLEFQYRSIETTIAWCCQEYLQRYTTNKD